MGTSSKIVKSFLPLFYISKYFGCNLYPLPKVFSASNVKINLRAIDILLCLIQFALTFSVTIPLINKWNEKDSPLRKELESKVSVSSVIILTIVATAATYAYTFIYLTIMLADMINASIIRNILVLFTNVDEQVFHFQNFTHKKTYFI